MRRDVEIRLRRLWRVHGRRLLFATLALAVVAARVVSSDDPAKRPPPPTRAQVCAAAQRAAKEIARQFPNAPREGLDAQAKAACTHDPTYAPVPEPTPVEATPGCHTLVPADRRPILPSRVATPPKRRVPFFAARSGKLPASGTPIVGGVQLPRGSRCWRFWSTDAGVQDAFGLARRLAAVFSSTGLWPVIWAWPSEEPDTYVNGTGDLSHADSLKAATVLRRSWQANGLARTRLFRAIAAGTDDKRLGVEPFGDAVEKSLMQPAPPRGWVVMLVPVNRPADVYSVLGTQTTELFSDDALTAVLRSWEERFGAVVSALTPSTVELAVGAPPRNSDQARRLADEHAAFAPEDDQAAGLDALARQLRSTRRLRGVTSAHYWVFGWPD